MRLDAPAPKKVHRFKMAVRPCVIRAANFMGIFQIIFASLAVRSRGKILPTNVVFEDEKLKELWE
jgi:hypothetical protein